RLEWEMDKDGRMAMKEVEDSATQLKADLVLLAMGFLHPVAEGLLSDLGVGLDGHGNVAADTKSYRTSIDKVFTAGDMRRGQSLVVWDVPTFRARNSRLVALEYCRLSRFKHSPQGNV
ncbi:MAG: FAD-dependent oxidoreductase, partial [Alphaproteobacteria bacterium]|nr:FAD-dependent oxidoreductase [Alphaproteobacteria bacterium]